MKNFIIKTDGRILHYEPKNGTDYSYEELSEIVGGYIEIVYLENGMLMVVNEEGKLNKLPLNANATAILTANFPTTHDYIVGDVLYCESELIK